MSYFILTYAWQVFYLSNFLNKLINFFIAVTLISLFNEFLKFNDGVLSAAIEKSKSVSKEEATKQIVGFATEVKSAIEKDGNYKLGSLGTFSKNEKGVP